MQDLVHWDEGHPSSSNLCLFACRGKLVGTLTQEDILVALVWVLGLAGLAGPAGLAGCRGSKGHQLAGCPPCRAQELAGHSDQGMQDRHHFHLNVPHSGIVFAAATSSTY